MDGEAGLRLLPRGRTWLWSSSDVRAAEGSTLIATVRSSFSVLGLIDDPHAATAQFLEDLVMR